MIFLNAISHGSIATFISLFLLHKCALADNTHSLLHEPISPIPITIDLNQDIVSLGQRLFNDPRLSHNNQLSCAQCHILAQGGDDNLPRSITNTGKADLINSPTVFNSVYNFRQTWRGAFKTLEAQAEGDLKNPRHGATDWPEIIPKLQADIYYVKNFNALFEQGITPSSVLTSIATFEKSLITPNARFDQYLKGNAQAISAEEKQGYILFKKYGCTACHQGINVGGNVFQKFGLFENYFEERGNITKADFGRMNVTGLEIDRYVFRVPSLRNIAVTAPYLHDGTVSSLKNVINIMAKFQLGTSIPKQDVKKIEKFLHTLTGEYKGQSLEHLK